MVEIRRIVVCTECELYWDEGSEPAKCRNDDHKHRVLETHRHLSPVVLPDGTRLTAASFDPVAPYSRTRDPDYGLYLDPRWPNGDGAGMPGRLGRPPSPRRSPLGTVQLLC